MKTIRLFIAAFIVIVAIAQQIGWIINGLYSDATFEQSLIAIMWTIVLIIAALLIVKPDNNEN